MIKACLALASCLLVVLAPQCAASDDLDPEREVLLIVDLPATVVYDVTVSDLLPKGLIYESESLRISGSKIHPKETVGDPNDGTGDVSITWYFGEVNNTMDQDIRIGFQAKVADAPDIRAGALLPGEKATLRWRDSSDCLHFSSDESDGVVIVEPDLILKRAILQDEYYEIITLQISHSPSSSAPAFDVDLTELLPSKMAYLPGSAEILSGPDGEIIEGTSHLMWHFDAVDPSWADAKKVILSYRAIPENQSNSQRPSAILSWTSAAGDDPNERKYFASDDGEGPISQSDQELAIAMIDDPDPVLPGGILNYTVNYRNSKDSAIWAMAHVIYDRNVSFLSASPPPDTGTEGQWTVGDISPQGSGTINISVRVNPSAPGGSELVSHAQIGSSSAALSRTKVIGSSALVIENNASSPILCPGGSLNYTLTFKNEGSEDALNVTVTDILDSNLQFDEVAGCTPRPSRIWRDDEGVHLFWNAETLGSRVLSPGQFGKIDLRARLEDRAEGHEIDRIINRYAVASETTAESFQSLETLVVRSVFIRKTAPKNEYFKGELVNYTILFGNEHSIEASDAVIIDRLPDVEFVGAIPSPSRINGNLICWELGTLQPHSSGSILLCVKIKKRPEVIFRDNQSVSGRGYVAARQMLNTSQQARALINYANITAEISGDEVRDSSCAIVNLLDAYGAAIETTQHGSGDLEHVQLMDYSTKCGIILKSHTRISHSPVSLRLSGKNQTVDSLWTDLTSSANYYRQEKLSESYQYMDEIEKDAAILLDPNQTVYNSQSEFSGGIAQMSYLHGGEDATSGGMAISERFHGNFLLQRYLDSYGRGASYTESSFGQGFVSTDKRTPSYESYLHGSGLYRSRETFAGDRWIHKNVSLIFEPQNLSAGSIPVNYTSKWREGLSVGDGRSGFQISSDAIQMIFLQKDALMDSSSLTMTQEFEGISSTKALTGWNATLDEIFAGRFSQDLKIRNSCPGLKWPGPPLVSLS
ncbi:MAG: hypothetical protein GYA29_03770 [Methanothrix sp.]|jgi:uncharacterized repeat protein (TIGR01451 family)|nr:hypothetical protein [Methanothrix sp.]OPY45302.1 MAG: hypothetical protein A4E46_01297 [Methanosaeta sp. PtaU1.Bin016]